jgi:hypothetical protein
METPMAADVALDWLLQRGFEEPFLVRDIDGLDMKLPPASTSISAIADIMGSSTPINIIEVGTQMEITGCTMGEYARYLEGRSKIHKTVNLISCEISTTPLSAWIQAPRIVRELDWIDLHWPLGARAKGEYPRVQKYCLCGMAGSYTDFHIDFGGTSVWYNVIWGKKIFFLVRPTIDNLNKFMSWSCSKNQDDIFLGDILADDELCYQVEVLPGQTLFLPSGYIHAVFTPVDSLVFGGNYVHSMSILTQLQTNVIETRTHVGNQYRFPHFKAIHWLALCALFEEVVVEVAEGGESDEGIGFTGKLVLQPKHLLSFACLVRTVELWHRQQTVSSETEGGKVVLTSMEEQFVGLTPCDTAVEVIRRWKAALLAIADKTESLRDNVEMIFGEGIFDIMSAWYLRSVGLLNFNEDSATPKTEDGKAVESVGTSGDTSAPAFKVKLEKDPQRPCIKIKKSQIEAIKMQEKEAVKYDSVFPPLEKAAPTLKLKLSTAMPSTAAPPSDMPPVVEIAATRSSIPSSTEPTICENRTRGHRISSAILGLAADYVEDSADHTAPINDRLPDDLPSRNNRKRTRQKEDEEEYNDEFSDSDPEYEGRHDSDFEEETATKPKKAAMHRDRKMVLKPSTPQSKHVSGQGTNQDSKPKTAAKAKPTIRQMLLKKMGR